MGGALAPTTATSTDGWSVVSGAMDGKEYIAFGPLVERAERNGNAPPLDRRAWSRTGDGFEAFGAFTEDAIRNGGAHLQRLADNRAVGRQQQACRRAMQHGFSLRGESCPKAALSPNLNPFLLSSRGNPGTGDPGYARAHGARAQEARCARAGPGPGHQNNRFC